jgi:SAM-dependent methyltransferase
MCHASCLEFGRQVLSEPDIKCRRVLEVGARDWNGSLRPYIESFDPAEYLGTDVRPGPGVDALVPVETLVARFGRAGFDLVVATEVLEHVRDWRAAVDNLKQCCRPNGTILFTTRSRGFPSHMWPHDYWRYELEDVRAIFADTDILALESDPEQPGVFALVRRRAGVAEAVLAGYELYSVLMSKRTAHAPPSGLPFLLRALAAKVRGS